MTNFVNANTDVFNYVAPEGLRQRAIRKCRAGLRNIKRIRRRGGKWRHRRAMYRSATDKWYTIAFAIVLYP